MFYALLAYIVASIFNFFQQNMQYIIPWWKGKALLSAIIFSIPIGQNTVSVRNLIGKSILDKLVRMKNNSNKIEITIN